MSAQSSISGVLAGLVAIMSTSASAQSLDGTIFAPPVEVGTQAPLPAGFLSARLALVAADVCDGMLIHVPDAVAGIATDEECSLTSEGLFLIARGSRSSVRNWRVKLSSFLERQAADLARLSELAKRIHDEIGWRLPELVSDHIRAGADISCVSGPVRYRFQQERTNPHDFNLLISLDIANSMSTSTFKRLPPPCH